MARVGVQAVADGPVAAAAATDQGHLDHVAAGRVGRAGEAGKREPGGRGRRALQKRTPRGEVRVAHEKLLEG